MNSSHSSKFDSAIRIPTRFKSAAIAEQFLEINDADERFVLSLNIEIREPPSYVRSPRPHTYIFIIDNELYFV
ncbi:MAG: hypothetical protein ACK8QZ_11215, partial [Anaerolineales bacterium]